MKKAVLSSKVRGITENSLLFNFEGPDPFRLSEKRAKTEYGLIAQPVRASA